LPARLRHQSKKPTIAARNQTPLLTELDDDSLGVGALNALECALILEHPFDWLDLRQHHRQATLRASSLPDGGLCWIEILWLRHWYQASRPRPRNEWKRIGLSPSV
jgi:hypothetical protein